MVSKCHTAYMSYLRGKIVAFSISIVIKFAHDLSVSDRTVSIIITIYDFWIDAIVYVTVNAVIMDFTFAGNKVH